MKFYLIEQQQEVDEGEIRYQKFKALEMKINSGEQIEEESLIRLRSYQNTGEYISKKDRDINLEEFKNKLDNNAKSYQANN